MRSAVVTSVLGIRAGLERKKHTYHKYELCIDVLKQLGKLLYTVLEVVDLLLLLPMFFWKPQKTLMIQNFFIFPSPFRQVLYFKFFQLRYLTHLKYVYNSYELLLNFVISCFSYWKWECAIQFISAGNYFSTIKTCLYQSF